MGGWHLGIYINLEGKQTHSIQYQKASFISNHFLTHFHFSMEPYSRLDNHSTRQRYSNVIRESDIRADPEYKQKKEFYDKLKIEGRILQQFRFLIV